jgi:hypothetical protein
MPVVDLQRRLREIGRIRMGEKRVSQKGREYPAATDTFRFTCASRGILEQMAAVVGGNVEPWENAPGGDQWQLRSQAREIGVVVPPVDEPFSQFYELWSAAGCQRRCDGERATVAVEQGDEIAMRERKCVCDPDDRECKLTTRASFILPWAPGIGVWRLESHGYNAAVELTGTLSYLARQASQGVYMECLLRLDKREKRVPGQPTNEYVVPVLDTDATPAQLMAGGMEPSTAPQIAPHGRPALPAGSPPPNGDGARFEDPQAPASGEPGWGTPPPPPSGEAARRGAPEPKLITEAQRRRLFAIAKEHGVATERVKEVVKARTGQDSSKQIPVDSYEQVVDDVRAVALGLDGEQADDATQPAPTWRGDPDDPREPEQPDVIEGQEALPT